MPELAEYTEQHLKRFCDLLMQGKQLNAHVADIQNDKWAYLSPCLVYM